MLPIVVWTRPVISVDLPIGRYARREPPQIGLHTVDGDGGTQLTSR